MTTLVLLEMVLVIVFGPFLERLYLFSVHHGKNNLLRPKRFSEMLILIRYFRVRVITDVGLGLKGLLLFH